MLGCLLALKNGLTAKTDEPVPSPTAASGLLDALTLAAESLPAGIVDALRANLATVPADLIGWADWLERAETLSREISIPKDDGAFWVQAVVDQIHGLKKELDAVCPWLRNCGQFLRTTDKLHLSWS